MNTTEQITMRQRAYYDSGATRDLEFRKCQLIKLKDAILENEAEIMQALREDLNKSEFESYETEIGIVLEEIGYLLKHMDRLARPKKVKTPITHFPSVSRIYREPYGVVLIMSPWNYPLQLALAPLAGALAAGNCAVVKPSNYSPRTSELIRRLIGDHFGEEYIAVLEGGRDINRSLLEQKFDYIFFTGSVLVGKTVMAAAAKHLTPVTLELGGKSPCIVDKTADVRLAAKRIVWGKFLNAGQTCVAPDYVLVHTNVKDQLIKEMGRYIRKFYGKDPISNPDYPKIINGKHFIRLCGLQENGTVVYGGERDQDSNKIAPTILDGVDWGMPVMQEEIFGPILPVLEFTSVKEMTARIRRRPKPLALYYFTRSRKAAAYVMNSLSFGGGCINDTIVHLASSYMPFGGVGESGMGGYHGDASFTTFSHEKSVLQKSGFLDVPLRYPPFKNHLRLVKKILK